MKKVLIAIFAVVLAAGYVFAGGSTAADILKIKTGARAMAMGGAYTAAGNDVEVINYNPAGLMLLSKKEMDFMDWLSYSGINVLSASYAQPLETALVEGVAGVSFVYRTIPDIDNADAGQPAVKYYDFVLNGAYANNLGKMFGSDTLQAFNVGLGAKLIIEQIDIYQGSSFAGDIGVNYAPKESPFKLGLSIMNLGPGIKFISDTSQLPITARIGGAYTLGLDKENSVTVGLDYIQDIFTYGQVAVGIEDNVLDILFFRGGYSLPVDTRSQQNIYGGVGIAVTQFDISLSLNYVYNAVLWNGLTAFDSTHSFGLQVKL